ncbi:SoxR reducing system RseC family protein [Maribellus maritimus]|uniref:SoxR reducing system RseC family protein n=1 Tax=Maribellus maritimus TaxID=2870838 RepID=UPI00293ED21C|nr:SoxR reducing system RseC family protein [Maribellus maritimus]
MRHRGFVKETRGNSLIVNIINKSACSACHAKGACTVADYQDKEIEITNFQKKYSPGQEVTVIFQESKGFTALFYGYVLPFIIVLLTLIVTNSVTNDELLSGLISLGILIPYYITLFFFRHLLKKVFKFEVEETI